MLLDTHDQAAFEEAVQQAAKEASQDGRTIVGIADRVPVDADLDLLCAIPGLISQTDVRPVRFPRQNLTVYP